MKNKTDLNFDQRSFDQQSFDQRCYELLKLIPKGKVSTYKELALALNSKGYRAVGNAMRKNPNAPKVPCHRVVCSDGSLGGYAYGVNKKEQILKKEGILIKNQAILQLNEFIFTAKDLKKAFLKF